MTINHRLGVEFKGGSQLGNCYYGSGYVVWRLNQPLTDAEATNLVRMSGFYGQDVRVTRRWEEKPEDNDHNLFHFCAVDGETDSSD